MNKHFSGKSLYIPKLIHNNILAKTKLISKMENLNRDIMFYKSRHLSKALCANVLFAKGSP
jgi:hypothetical protein